MTQIKIGSYVKEIKKEAFSGCTALTSVTIGDGVEKIDQKAFYGCKNLKKIIIKTNKLTSGKVGSTAFKGISSKATIKVPAKKAASYKKILKKKGIGSDVKITV